MLDIFCKLLPESTGPSTFMVFCGLQRGTGLSTPLTVSSLSQLGSATKLADYMKHFRADSIVNDAEFIRVRLVPDAEPWTILGQV